MPNNKFRNRLFSPLEKKTYPFHNAITVLRFLSSNYADTLVEMARGLVSSKLGNIPGGIVPEKGILFEEIGV